MITLESIRQKCVQCFPVQHIDVIDESHKHQRTREFPTHVKLVLVSEHFVGKSLLARHQAVYNCLNNELQCGLHALSIHAFTPEEWQQRQGVVNKTPPCRGTDNH